MFNTLEGKRYSGITLLEVIMVVALLAIISGFILTALRPGENLAEARNLKRRSDITQILSAVSLYIADKDNSIADLGAIKTCPATNMIGTGDIDLSAKLSPSFLLEIPYDPATGDSSSTGYTMCQDSAERIKIAAPNAENAVTIVTSR